MVCYDKRFKQLIAFNLCFGERTVCSLSTINQMARLAYKCRDSIGYVINGYVVASMDLLKPLAILRDRLKSVDQQAAGPIADLLLVHSKTARNSNLN